MITGHGALVKTWTFQSNSNPNKSYETSQYEDGFLSCQCKGWCIAKHGTRTCTHTRQVEQGIADRTALSSWTAQVAPVQRANIPAMKVMAEPAKAKKRVSKKVKVEEAPLRIVNWRE